MMAVLTNVNSSNYKESISSGKVIVYFTATWCGPCRMLSPIYEQLSNELPHIKFIKVDVDDHKDLAAEFGIMSIPTLFIYEDSKLIKKRVGGISKVDLKNLLV